MPSGRNSENPQIALAAEFPHLVVDQHLMHDGAAIVLAGEKPEAAAADVAVERQNEVVLAHELLPKLLAVVAALARIGVRVAFCDLPFLAKS